ncbi:MAG: hypothetical protein KAJ91_03535 [Candidatus Aenigmarchaeota archaeon]|nr:hypothetical protein [Candidatus Aenigmarchaeota archaeon]
MNDKIDAMNSITPYILTKGTEANPLASEGYKVKQSGGFNIVYKDILADPSLIDADGLTKELRASFETLQNVGEKIYDPGALVRNPIRGRLVGGKPSGYIVELSEKGPTVYAAAEMETVPSLIAIGSLLSPGEIAGNTEEGNLRNELDSQAKHALAEKKGITKNISYVEISGLELIFDRTPTVKRYGTTQDEWDQWAVLNSRSKKDAKAYGVLFDPATLTKDPRNYLLEENYDEGEYLRWKVPSDQITLLGGSKQSLGKDEYAWVLRSSLISDAGGSIHVIASKPNSKIHKRYREMLTTGLAGAEQVVPEFANMYVESVIQANGRPLSENVEFMGALEEKLSAYRNADAYTGTTSNQPQFEA